MHTTDSHKEKTQSTWKEAEYFLRWTLGREDKDLVLRFRGNAARLHAAIQLLTIRKSGRTCADIESVPTKIILFLCESLEIPPLESSAISIHSSTASKQLAIVMQHLGLQEYGEKARSLLQTWTQSIVGVQKPETELLQTAEQFLRSESYLLPAPSTLQRDLRSARGKAEDVVFAYIAEQLLPHQKVCLDKILTVEEKGRCSQFQNLKNCTTGTSSESLRAEIEKFEFLRQRGFLRSDFGGLEQDTIEWMADLGRRYDASELKSFSVSKRYALCSVFLCEHSATILDAIVRIQEAYLSSMESLSRRTYESKMQDSRKSSRAAISLLLKTMEKLLGVESADTMTVDEFLKKQGEEGLRKALKDAKLFSRLDKRGFVDELCSKHGSLRIFAAVFLNLNFQPTAGTTELFRAIEIQRKMNLGKQKDFPPDTPLDFVPKMYQSLANPLQKGSGRKAWEMFLFMAIRDRLRSGDLVLPESRSYRPLWEQIGVKLTATKKMRDEAKKSFEPFRDKLIQEFNRYYKEFSRDFAENSYVSLKPDQTLKLSRDDGESESPEVGLARKLIRSEMPSKVRIEDLLTQVLSLTRFDKCFTSIHGQEIRMEGFEQTLLGALIAEGTNLGNEDMAACSDGLTVDSLDRISHWYLRELCHKEASQNLILFIQNLPISANWGDGTRSSSDGQRFAVERKSDFTRAYPRYFGHYDKAFTIYTHVSDTYSAFSTQVIGCHEREALYVLNGILDLKSSFSIQAHSTDTHGYTDVLFGLMYLLGISFQPHIADLADARIFRPEQAEIEPKLSKIFSDKIDLDIVAEQWQEIQKLKIALTMKTISADILMQRLTKTLYADRMSKAVGALGRMVKSIWVLRYLNDRALRGKVRKQLNRGEERHALAKKLFFANQGRLRTGDRLSMMNKASCLSLLSNGVLAWNAWHMQKAVDKLASEGIVFSTETLSHISPLMHEHVIPSGSYEFKKLRFGAESRE